VQETDALTEIQSLLGYDFTDLSLLVRALTHSSYTNEIGIRHADSNERLEFLGDAVTGLGVASLIYESYPRLAEGKMSALRANLVKSDSLAELARSLKLGAGLRLGVGADKTGLRQHDSVLEDAFEAVMGAVFLDGGSQAARTVIRSLFGVRLAEQVTLLARGDSIDDYKTLLQIEIQRKGTADIRYQTIAESGLDHEKIFCAAVSVEGKRLGEGTGKTKKEAEKMAAKMALEGLGCI
jgi:ribonuclease-3